MLLPDYMVEYFEVIKFEQERDNLHLYFEEKNVAPSEFSTNKLTSKGFFEEIVLQDFPIRGQHSFLHIKQRRWLNHRTGKVVTRNWDLVAKGTRMTAEFASFLNEISRF